MSVEQHTLSNGATVLIDHMPDAQTSALSYTFRIGSRYETEEENGLAHFFEHMAFKGTDNVDVHSLNTKMDDLGAQTNAFTSREVTSYYRYGLNEDVFKFNEIEADMAMNLTLPADELEKERDVILEEIKMYADQPGSNLSDGLYDTLYSGQALGRTILGPPENIKSFDRDIFDRFRSKHYHAGNLVVSVAGGADPQKILQEVLNAKGIKVERGIELTDISVKNAKTAAMSLQDSDGKIESLSSNCVFAADGHKSIVREKLDLKMIGSSYEEPWYAYDVALECPLAPNEAHILLYEDSGIFLIRIRNNIWRIMSKQENVLENLPEPFQVGEIIVHPNGRTITEEHMALTYGVGNSHPLHFDRVFSSSLSGKMSGEPIVYGGLVFAWLDGLASRDVSEQAVWELGFTEGYHTQPAFAGDTVTALSRVLAAEPAPEDDAFGIVTFQLIGCKNVSAAAALEKHGADLFVKEDSKRALGKDKISDKIFEIERRLVIKRRPG